MAAFDAVTSLATVTASPATGTHTPAGTPTLVLIFDFEDATTHGTNGTVTYGGQTCTLVDSQLSADATTFSRVSIYRLVSPPSGGQTATVPWTGGTTVTKFAVVATYTGSNTTTPVGTPAKNSGTTATDVTTTVVGATGDLIVAGAMGWGGTGPPTFTAGAGQTDRVNASDAGSGERWAMSDEAGAASVVMNWTASGNTTGGWAIVGVAVKNAAAGGGRTTKNTEIPRGVAKGQNRRFQKSPGARMYSMPTIVIPKIDKNGKWAA